MGHGKAKRWKKRAQAAVAEAKGWEQSRDYWEDWCKEAEKHYHGLLDACKGADVKVVRDAEDRYPVAVIVPESPPAAPGFGYAQVPIGPDWNGALYKGARADWWADQVEKYKEERAEVRAEADRERKRREEAERSLAAEKQIGSTALRYRERYEAEQTLRREAENRLAAEKAISENQRLRDRGSYWEQEAESLAAEVQRLKNSVLEWDARLRKALASALDSSDRSTLNEAAGRLEGHSWFGVAGRLRALSEKGLTQTEASPGEEKAGQQGAVSPGQTPETD